MKYTAFFPFCFFALFSISAAAQKTNVWQGGAAGHETDWSFFKNWRAGKVPNEFDLVIIPDVSTSTGKKTPSVRAKWKFGALKSNRERP